MFTGLIKEIGKVVSFRNDILTISSTLNPNIGDSISVNGACLTVIEKFDNGFSVELSSETQKVVAIENYSGFVHLEPAMKLSDRLEGHIIQGHIDGIGRIGKIEKLKTGIDFFIEVDRNLIKLIAPKGSIAIDGVSLTINEVFSNSFRITIIPHTLKNTLFSSYKVGRRVNIETDLFIRYINHLLKFKKDKINFFEAIF